MTVVTNRKSTDENVPFVRTGSSNQLYFSVANHSSSFTVAAVVLCVMLTVKKGIFVARAFHVVHPESAIDSSKFGLHSGVTRREPQHPAYNQSAVCIVAIVTDW
jgi:hypothetical protein